MRRTIEHNTKLSEVSNSRYYISYRHYTAYLAVGDSFAGTRPVSINEITEYVDGGNKQNGFCQVQLFLFAESWRKFRFYSSAQSSLPDLFHSAVMFMPPIVAASIFSRKLIPIQGEKGADCQTYQ